MIAVFDYGIGNLASACKALNAVGANAQLITDPSDATRADGYVLPGVGSFGACMKALKQSGLESAVRGAIASDKPFLGICVGLQMLFESSEESPGVPGLGVLDGQVSLMTGDVKLPQMQWNRLDVNEPHYLFDGIDKDAWFYFVHSYAAPSSPNVIATCDYGQPVTAAIAKDNVVATQFHPEKSSKTGLALLKNFVSRVDAS